MSARRTSTVKINENDACDAVDFDSRGSRSSDCDAPVDLDALAAEIKRDIDSVGVPMAHDEIALDPSGSSDRDELERLWAVRSRYLPGSIRTRLETIKVAALRLDALAKVEQEFFGWSDRKINVKRPQHATGNILSDTEVLCAEVNEFFDVGCRALDQIEVKATWNNVMHGPGRHHCLRIVNRVVDDGKRVAHESRLITPGKDGELNIVEPVDGILVVNDPRNANEGFGRASYLEATPHEVPAYVVTRWRQGTPAKSCRAWDLTAGSGTVTALVEAMNGRCVGTDIALDDGLTALGDLREVGRHPLHRDWAFEKVVEFPSRPDFKAALPAPDLIFIDPPSRGTPTHTELLRGTWPALDLAGLDRADWIATAVDCAATSVRYLHEGGLVSLLVREGVRHHQDIEPDPELAEDVLRALRAIPHVNVVETLRVVYGHRIPQASANLSRCPMVHILLGHADHIGDQAVGLGGDR